ncbi:MAG: serine/threonine-protein kinase [Planctomycetota bacterium]
MTAVRPKIPGYKLLEVRGVGAMATVYVALQTRLERRVALKVLHEHTARDLDYRERFLREAKAAARLNHQNVVRAYEAGVCDGRYWFAMELVEGEDLSDRLNREGSLSEDEALHIAGEIARALEAAEEHGMVHRDVKPENVLLGDDGAVKLADLGLAKVEGDASLTADGYSLGTVAFFSPEQCRGARDLDVRSDLFALGGTLYTMLTGSFPFGRGDAPPVTMQRILSEWPEDIDDPTKFATSTREAITTLMAKEREERPASAADAVKLLALARARAGESQFGPVEPLSESSSNLSSSSSGRTPPKRKRKRRGGVMARSAPSGCAALVLGWVALGLAAWALPQLVQVAWAGERAR